MASVYHLLYGCFTPVCCSCKIFDRKKKPNTTDFSDEMILPQKPRSNSIFEKEKKQKFEMYQKMVRTKKEKKESEKDPTEKICLSCYCFPFFPFFEQNTENSKTI